MVAGKKKGGPPRHTISQSSGGVFDDSRLYELITSSSIENMAASMKRAIFTNYEDVHLRCPDTGRKINIIIIHR